MNRLLAIIRKEFIQIFRDKATLLIMLMIPLLQLILFGYAINTDVKHLPMALLDYSNSGESRRLIQSFTNSGYFDIKYFMKKQSDINDLLDNGQVKLGLIIDRDFERDIKAGRNAQIQAVVDASDPMIAGSAISNSQGIATQKSLDLLFSNLRPGCAYRPPDMPVNVSIRAWYNPDQVSANYIVPGLIGIILCMNMMMLTAMGIVRERETGTLEQLITTPIKSHELMLGKIIPYILIGYVQMTIALLVGGLVFGVPVKGSLLLLYSITFFFIVCYLGIGMLISGIARTQQQAMQMSFMIFLPTMLLAGFMFPREGMPIPAQYLGFFIPLTFFLEVVRGIVLKGVGLLHIWRFLWPMILMTVLILSAGIMRFKKQMD